MCVFLSVVFLHTVSDICTDSITNCRFLLGILLVTLCKYNTVSLGNSCNYDPTGSHADFLCSQPTFPPEHFDTIYPPDGVDTTICM